MDLRVRDHRIIVPFTLPMKLVHITAVSAVLYTIIQQSSRQIDKRANKQKRPILVALSGNMIIIPILINALGISNKLKCNWYKNIHKIEGGRGRDRMVVGFTTNLCNECLSPLKL